MAKKSVSKNDERKLRAFLTTFLSIVGFVIALIFWRNDKYTMFYAKQSLVIFIAWAIAAALQMVFGFIPVLGWIIRVGLTVIMVIAWVLSWVYALSLEEKDVPIIGEWARKFDL